MKLIYLFRRELGFFSLFLAFFATGLLLFKDLYFHNWEEKKETIIYSIPLVFVFFIWVWTRLKNPESFKIELIYLDIIVVGLSAVRILGWLFHSGHVLFLLYTFVTTKNLLYRLICLPMIGITIYFKSSSGDLLSPIIATFLGVIFIILRKKYLMKLD